MSTIASLISLIDPSAIKPWSEGVQSATQAQTGLRNLADLKAKQQAEQLVLERMKTDPALAQQLFGEGPVLGSLGSAGGMPGAGGGAGPAPLMQQQVMPGQPPGAPQVVPGGQDLSQFAMQGGPPQSTLASLGPAGQSQMQAPRNPVLEMAQRNPRAAMMLQDQQIKAFTTQLSIREKTAEAFATKLQGVNSQESYGAAVQDLTQWAPQQAARLPRVWSKEAMQPIIDSALSAKDKASLQIQELNAQTQAGTLGLARQRAAQTIPNYTGDAQLDAIIYTKMKDQPSGTMPSREIVEGAYRQREEDKLRVSRDQGAAQEALKPLGETATLRFNTLTQAEDTVKKLTTEFSPEERRKFVGMGGMSFTAEQLKQLAADATGGKADPKFARFAALVALAKAEAFSTAGKALTKTEEGVVYGYIPTGKEYSGEEFEQKLTLAQERIPSMLDRELKLATTPRSELSGMRARGELGASTSVPGRQAPAANTFTDADIAATLANPANKGKTRQQVLDAALAKGLIYKER